MDKFQKYFLSLSSSEQQTLLREMTAITESASLPGNTFKVKRELNSPETPYQGESRKVHYLLENETYYIDKGIQL
jgi:hypothetical protein